jgi:hypothetical protein
MKNPKIISKPKDEINWDKTKQDLDFIKSLKLFCDSLGWRIVISGGYGLDILLGQITRSHNDLDIIIYGQSPRKDVIVKMKKYFSNLRKSSSLKISENEFMIDFDLNSPGFGSDIYYVEINNNPYINLNEVIKSNGEKVFNTPKRFPPPVIGKLNDLEIDVQNPNTHLADILFKQQSKPHKLTHDQDIANLRLFADEEIVDEILRLS